MSSAVVETRPFQRLYVSSYGCWKGINRIRTLLRRKLEAALFLEMAENSFTFIQEVTDSIYSGVPEEKNGQHDGVRRIGKEVSNVALKDRAQTNGLQTH
eukprot:3596637-Amphidinium_carterae.1